MYNGNMSSQSMKFLAEVLLKSPETGKRLKILKVDGAEIGLKHLRIHVGNKTEKYRLRIYISEV